MNKMLFMALTLVMGLTFSAYSRNGNGISENSSQVTSTQTGGGDSVSDNSDVRIKLMFNNEEVIVNMYNNPTSWDFLSLLPLKLTLEDYARTEKISYLARKLSTEAAPSGSDPSVGDFTYYAPWGNLAIFYKDFGYSDGLIIIGKIESGIDKLASISGTVTIEKID